MTALLTQEQVDDLPAGEVVEVNWSGGNGPWRYIVTVDKWGRRYAASPHAFKETEFYNPLDHCGVESFHTQVSVVPHDNDCSSGADFHRPLLLEVLPVTTLDVFLLTRYAEERAVAEAAVDTSPRWIADGSRIDDGHDRTVVYDEGRPTLAQAMHITCWDPQAVLADLTAKRGIVGWHTPSTPHGRRAPISCFVDYEAFPCMTLRYLALPYRRHPGYLPEWKPLWPPA